MQRKIRINVNKPHSESKKQLGNFMYGYTFVTYRGKVEMMELHVEDLNKQPVLILQIDRNKIKPGRLFTHDVINDELAAPELKEEIDAIVIKFVSE